MNTVNVPTELRPQEAYDLVTATCARFVQFVDLIRATPEDKLPQGLKGPMELCYDNQGRVIVRFQPKELDAVLQDIRSQCPEAMKAAKAESTEENIQYPNLAFYGVPFVTFDKDDVDAICNSIDNLCNMAFNNLGGVDNLARSEDPDLQRMGLAFSRLFDRQGGLIYNNGHSMTNES